MDGRTSNPIPLNINAPMSQGQIFMGDNQASFSSQRERSTAQVSSSQQASDFSS
jgi:hypothetical protein